MARNEAIPGTRLLQALRAFAMTRISAVIAMTSIFAVIAMTSIFAVIASP
ncbi:MAG: hypothetical protein GXY15_11920 [Candidatus Hydrogenedentes bacterium]|nr:hypothetical protein [Candidatus Hydrogenedentota bacterium]